MHVYPCICFAGNHAYDFVAPLCSQMSNRKAVLRDPDSDEEFDQRQNTHKFPWEHGNARGEWFQPGADTTWERKGYRDDSDKFRKDVRRTIANQRADGRTRDELYGGTPTKSDVGHIFADSNGGSNTLGNIYMQPSGMNRDMKADFDDVNAAWVGYARTEKAMKESRGYGELDGGRWAQWNSTDVVDSGKAKLKQVGVLTKQGGELDKRSPAYRNGDLKVDPDGHVRGMQAKMKELRKIGKAKEDDDDLAHLFGSGMSGLGRR